MIHKLYSAYDLPADHDTCHLFEHLIIRRLLKKTEKAGGNRAFTGELDGTTSESSVFFTSALFTSESNTLFEKPSTILRLLRYPLFNSPSHT